MPLLTTSIVNFESQSDPVQQLPPTALYIKTRARNNLEVTYDLQISAGGQQYVDEGSVGTPTPAGDLTAGSVSYMGQVGLNNSYYTVTAAGGTTYAAENVILTLVEASNRTSTVDLTSNFTITGLTGATKYQVSISAMSGAADIAQLSDGIQLKKCDNANGLEDETSEIDLDAAVSSLDIQIDGGNASSGASFVLNVQAI